MIRMIEPNVNSLSAQTSNYPYYFEVLPVHKPPLPLESLTSFVSRLAWDNRIRSVRGISAVCFPTQAWQLTRKLSDIQPLDMVGLSQVAVCSESRLLETTFHHLAVKFGRSTNPQAVSSFLSGTLSASVRYCTQCLRTDAILYYRLHWRFLMLEGCAVHGCKLLERCWRCGEVVPLFAAPFQLGTCHVCGADLRDGEAENLSTQEWEATRTTYADLEFYLAPYPPLQPLQPLQPLESPHSPHSPHSPQSAHLPLAAQPRPQPSSDADASALPSPCTPASGCTLTPPTPASLIGQRFRYLRQIVGMSQLDVQSVLGLRAGSIGIKGIECGNIRQYGGRFQLYLDYAGLLGISLPVLMQGKVDDDPDWVRARIEAYKKAQRDRAFLPDQEQETRTAGMGGLHIEAAEIANEVVAKRVTPQGQQEERAGQDLGESSPNQLLPHSLHLPEESPRKRRRATFDQREGQIMVEIRRAVPELKASGRKVTRAAVFRHTGISRAAVYHYPKAKALLDTLVPRDDSAWYRLRRELILLRRLHAAERELAQQSLPITHNALYKAIGASRSGLVNQPKVVAAIAKAVAEYESVGAARLRAAREGELLKRLEATILLVESNGVPVTQYAVCAEMGLTAAGLRYYPAVCARLEQLVDGNGPRGKRKRRQQYQSTTPSGGTRA